MRAVLVALAAAAVAVAPAHAGTGANVYTVAVAYRFAPADVPVPAGSRLTLVNGDADAHDITSFAPGTVAGHLFASATLGARGEKAEVVGVGALPSGIYEFYCSVHPEMLGSVVVP